jgi:hypothetical protein
MKCECKKCKHKECTDFTYPLQSEDNDVKFLLCDQCAQNCYSYCICDYCQTLAPDTETYFNNAYPSHKDPSLFIYDNELITKDKIMCAECLAYQIKTEYALQINPDIIKNNLAPWCIILHLGA